MSVFARNQHTITFNEGFVIVIIIILFLVCFKSNWRINYIFIYRAKLKNQIWFLCSPSPFWYSHNIRNSCNIRLNVYCQRVSFLYRIRQQVSLNFETCYFDLFVWYRQCFVFLFLSFYSSGNYKGFLRNLMALNEWVWGDGWTEYTYI